MYVDERCVFYIHFKLDMYGENISRKKRKVTLPNFEKQRKKEHNTYEDKGIRETGVKKKRDKRRERRKDGWIRSYICSWHGDWLNNFSSSPSLLGKYASTSAWNLRTSPLNQ